MPVSDYKKAPLTVNDKKIPAKYQMAVSERKRSSFTENYTIILVNEQIPAKKQKRCKWPEYNTEDEFLVGPTFSKYFKEYHDPKFYRSVAYLQVKHYFTRDLLQEGKDVN